MKMLRGAVCVAVAAAAGTVGAAEQKVTGPVATYWMSASTVSGLGGMMGGMGGGGHRPSLGSMMMGGYGGGMDPNAFSHTLILQLGSSLRPSGPPQAEHDPPQGLGAGPSLPLVTPQPQQAPRYEESTPGPPPQYQQPHGRMLIFWGCGEHAGPDQPLVIDFAKIGPQGQGMGPMMEMMRGLAVEPMQPPSPSRNTTYGEWPNAQSSAQVPPEGSLQGDHLVKGDYSPDIHFTLAADQDFLPPIQLTTNAINPSGSASLVWRPVDGAKGFFATMFGGGEGGDVVMWTSSQSRAPAFGMPDYLSDHEIHRLVDGGVLMPGSATSCTVPQEAVQAARHGFYQMTAYGGENNISYPPRPPAPQTWHIAWQVKLRYRSQTAGLLGMAMPGGGRPGHAPQGEDQDQDQQPAPRPHPNPFNPFGGGLGGFIP